MKILQKLIALLVAVLAFVVGIVPGLIAVDSGGVLPWSRWLASSICAVLLLVTLPVMAYSHLRPGLRAITLPVLVLALGAYALLQTVPLSDGLLSILSGGSYDAWHGWLGELASTTGLSQLSGGNTVSVFSKGTLGFSGWTAIVATMIWLGTIAASSRNRALTVLVLISMAGTAHALAGIWQTVLEPNATLWGIPASGPYGVFVNRNNAGGFLIISMAASAGLIAWRFTALTGQKVGGYHFDSSAFLDLVSDRVAVSASAMFGIMGVAIVVSGSRGAVAGLITAIAIAFGAFGEGRALKRLFAAIVILGLVGCVLFVKIGSNPVAGPTSSEQAALAESIQNEVRWQHWKDAAAAGIDYLPAGSGFGSYRFAYLPYQQSSLAGWFLNADNLWLEWCVEGGLVAILLLLAIAFFFFRDLLHLRNSIEPIDQGIVSAGWFIASGVLVSQAFDFGLTLAGAASGAGLMIGVVVSRANFQLDLAVIHAGTASAKPKSSNRTQLVVALTLTLLMAGTASLATTYYKRAAIVDAELRSARVTARGVAGIGAAIDRLAGLQIRDYDLDLELALLHHRRANGIIGKQWAEAGFLPSIQTEGNRSYLRGFAYLSKVSASEYGLDAESEQKLQAFIENVTNLVREDLQQGEARAALALSSAPLSAEARFLLADFQLLTGSQDQVSGLLNQLQALRGNAVDSMAALAEIAAVVGDWEVAGAAWAKLSGVRPKRTPKYLRAAQLLGFSDLESLIPEDAIAWRSLGKAMQDAELDLPEILPVVIERLLAEVPEGREKRAQHYVLISELYLLNLDKKNAEKMLNQAAKANPFNVDLRMRYINYLKSVGKFSLAITECDAAAKDTREVERFNQKKKELDQLKKEKFGG